MESGTSPLQNFVLGFKNNRDGSSSTSECEYLISMNNGSYKFKYQHYISKVLTYKIELVLGLLEQVH